MTTEADRRIVHRVNRAPKRGTVSLQDRRNDFDVCNRVQVSSTAAVRDAVQELFQESFPGADFDAIWMAFHDFDRLFEGHYQDYLGCDTVYHDKQHSLDMALAMARLLTGYERSCSADDQLGAGRAVLGLITALFHDSGYIRRITENHRHNGAELTGWHVSRSARFLKAYLPTLALGEYSELAAQIVHFTGYELDLDNIELDDPRDTSVGHLLGTADLIAQMADRCYLEKCRDRLFNEFVLAGIAFERTPEHGIRYRSGIDLLCQTPDFWKTTAGDRLERCFNRGYRYIEAVYDGANPYMEFIEANLLYLGHLIESEEWQALRRNPACFTAAPDTLQSVGALVSRRLATQLLPAAH